MLRDKSEPHPHSLRGVVITALPISHLPTRPVWIVSASFPAWAFYFINLQVHLQGIILVDTAVSWACVLQEYLDTVDVCCVPHEPPK